VILVKHSLAWEKKSINCRHKLACILDRRIGFFDGKGDIFAMQSGMAEPIRTTSPDTLRVKSK
jgi:hypothetical protein